MSDTKKDKDQEKGDKVLKRMLKTPPKPSKESLTESDDKEGGRPDKPDDRG